MNSTLLLIAAIVALTRAQTIDECLTSDSISCIQTILFRKAKEFFNKDSLEIIAGVSLVKEHNSRVPRSRNDLIYEQQIEKADNVVTRQDTLKQFMEQVAIDISKGRSLKISFTPLLDKIRATARAVTKLIPAEIRQVADDVEGRGKKKHIKHMMPFLMAAKAKFGLLMTMSYFAIALLAKKAMLAAAIAIAISIFLALKSYHHHKPEKYEHHEYHEHHKKHDDHHHHGSSLSSSWSVPATNSWSASAGWEDGAYSAQTQAYSSYNR
ncbi:uncharacterized protein LOC131665683 [Phymastichus coffea]|uniref:uncharacterized protein LOC131665683 n=1 Tax=Phymastichus coffea TaxID=108790 RepID=UPI00273AF541|nr:uncharacterized protein LOC131665683 [Phymastichus coffea]